jgi:alcohol dehydrogenase class IV
MTDILEGTDGGTKTTRRDLKIQPETVIYDPDLLATLPDSFAATSGLDAIAHTVEGLYAADGNPIVELIAEEGIRAMAAALPRSNAGDDEALYGAWLCSAVLGSAARALGVADAAVGLHDLAKSIGAPAALKDIGMNEQGLDRAADIAIANPIRTHGRLRGGRSADCISWLRAGRPVIKDQLTPSSQSLSNEVQLPCRRSPAVP